ncbi:RecB family exonuclease [Schlesneria sp. T3-172]|uniref:RecB family exonuclease n=1 Tax=Schlesneria sphaerica TaxID=3373610 RepID=UPI0037CC941F
MITLDQPACSASEIAKQLTGRNYLSWSAVSSYLKCPLRYQFHYLDQLPEAFVSSNLVFGSAVHASLEAFFREQLVARQSLGIDALMAVYHETWIATDLANVRFGKDESLIGHEQLAQRMFRAFLDSQVSRPDGSILGIEEQLQAPVIDGCPDLQARIDLMIEHPDSLVVTDFKTSRSRWSENDATASEGQLLIYHELVRELANKPVRLQFAVITKTKEPTIELKSIVPESQKIERIRRLIQNVWLGIKSGVFYPVPNVMNCPTCGYRDRCSRWVG